MVAHNAVHHSRQYPSEVKLTVVWNYSSLPAFMHNPATRTLSQKHCWRCLFQRANSRKEVEMPIEEAEYCRRICGAKCCYLYLEQPIPCSNLAADNSCSIYEERFAEEAPDIVRVGEYEYKGRRRPFFCGRILLVADSLPDEVTKGCCVLHPHLLDKF